MSLKEFILSRTFAKHLAAAVILVAVLVFAVMQSLKIYTRHGVSYPVPDFYGMTSEQAFEAAKSMNVTVEIADSVYLDEAPAGVVVEQLPTAGFRVKENRMISLTINSVMPEQILLPQLTNISVRQAMVWAENSGLKTGRIVYEPSEYNDLVLKVRIDSTEIQPGQPLYKGATIDLVVGRIYGSSEVPLPWLTGLTPLQAQDSLANFMLNIGVVIYDSLVVTGSDSLNARIWRQTPSPDMIRNVYTGSSVDVWVSVDSTKFLPIAEPDSIVF